MLSDRVLESVENFLAGKKTYLVAAGTLIYALGIRFHYWPHDADIDLMFGGTAAITVRSALARLTEQYEADRAARRRRISRRTRS